MHCSCTVSCMGGCSARLGAVVLCASMQADGISHRSFNVRFESNYPFAHRRSDWGVGFYSTITSLVPSSCRSTTRCNACATGSAYLWGEGSFWRAHGVGVSCGDGWVDSMSALSPSDVAKRGERLDFAFESGWCVYAVESVVLCLLPSPVFGDRRRMHLYSGTSSDFMLPVLREIATRHRLPPARWRR